MFDTVIIGAGVIGLSIARALAEQTNKSVLVIEKEESYGRGISSRNSEVIHSGIYYDPHSLKAKYCTEGRDLLYDFCKKENVWHNPCGKLVVGHSHQKAELNALYQNGLANGVPNINIIERQDIQKMEPHIEAYFALHVECTGIISAHELMTAFYRISQSSNHDYLFKSRVVGANAASNGYILDIENAYGEIEQVECSWVINASGLGSDLIAQMMEGDFPSLRFSKGCYYKLASQWRNAFNHLIYPLPDKAHGSLGIHLSFDETQTVKLGPSAHWVDGRTEDYHVKSILLDQFYNEGKRYIKGLEKDHLSPDYAGIRPKIWTDDNAMPDFYISHETEKGFPGWVNLIGIESPGLTASIAIGNDVANQII